MGVDLEISNDDCDFHHKENVDISELELGISGFRAEPFYLAPIIYVSALVALIFLGILAYLVPDSALIYCCARRSQERAMQPSQLVVHADLVHRRQQVLEQLARAAAMEQDMIGALDALPTQRWHKAHAADGEDEAYFEDETCRVLDGPEECCLCLDAYREEDEVRVLPCEHYFHKVCVDRWFASRRSMPRSCPQCRRNPIVGGQASPTDRGVGSQESDSTSYGEVSSAPDAIARHGEEDLVLDHAAVESSQSTRGAVQELLSVLASSGIDVEEVLPGAVRNIPIS